LIFNGTGAADSGAIASVYRSSRSLSGAGATRESFFSDAANRLNWSLTVEEVDNDPLRHLLAR